MAQHYLQCLESQDLTCHDMNFPKKHQKTRCCCQVDAPLDTATLLGCVDPRGQKTNRFFFFREVNGLGQLNPFGVGGFEPPCCVPQRFAQKAN